MQSYPAGIRLYSLGKLFSILICLALCCVPAMALSTGLHNSTRTFTAVSEMTSKDWDDPVEMERVWQAALVRIPKPGGGYIATTVKKLHTHHLEESTKFPAVIYMHGCSGIWKGTHTRINFLAANGHAVIAPPSLARKKYPKSCEPEHFRGGMYRDILKIRHFDAGYAIEKAKILPWVDANHVFLMGLSEGGIAVATFRSKAKNASVKARIVEGWTCQSTAWEEYRGIQAPADEPVLTLLGAHDPWFQNPYTSGECTGFVNRHNGSKSAVYAEGSLSYKHALLEDKKVQAVVLDFLKVHH